VAPRQAAPAQPHNSGIAGAAHPATARALINLQDEYRAWLDNLPANLEGSRLG
jgi:hypothetical protein